ncbi:MAG: PIN domain-containing protein [Caldilineae bacterium]|nr:MAG: PIN domain-containing protein [Caldilineae bacterium]
MIYLDTHVVVWLYAGLIERFSSTARDLINDNELLISPTVRLELQYLHEIQRVLAPPDAIIADLSHRIGLQVDATDLNTVVTYALTASWTRDPFDRLIVATAHVNGRVLVTKDRRLLAHYPHARW